MIEGLSCGVVVYDEVSDIKRLVALLKTELCQYKPQFKVEWVFILNHEQSEIRHWIKDWALANIETVICIENPSNNLGYARQLILENSSHSHIYMTDPDIEILPESLIKLLRLAETEIILGRNMKIIGFSGPLLHRSQNQFLQETYDSILKFAKKIPFAFQIQHHSHLESVDHIPSCHLLLKKDRAIEIGGFSPLFVKVGEDLDFSHRAYNDDYRFVYLPSAPAYHDQNMNFSKWLYKVFQFGKVQISVQKRNFSKGLRFYRLLPVFLSLIFVSLSVFFYEFFIGVVLTFLCISIFNNGFFGFILTVASYSVGEFFEILFPTVELKSESKLRELKQNLANQILKSNT